MHLDAELLLRDVGHELVLADLIPDRNDRNARSADAHAQRDAHAARRQGLFRHGRGNVVSTVKDACYTGQKLMIIDYIDENGSLTGNQAIAFDVADAGIGDTVLVNVEGGSANMFLGRSVIADLTICGVIDHITLDGETREYH